MYLATINYCSLHDKIFSKFKNNDEIHLTLSEDFFNVKHTILLLQLYFIFIGLIITVKQFSEKENIHKSLNHISLGQ